KTSIFSHPVYLFLRKFSLQDSRGGSERLALVACLLAVIPALNLASSDAAAVAGLVMTVLTVGLVSRAGKSLPRFWPGDFFPTFYGCHLAVLGILAL
ncbi:TraX family protein, partial [Escherichia coli]|uniref:TraX family protein n=1 Tax=Escherichia coli TaxID=562 RepID=UPI00292A9E27